MFFWNIIEYLFYKSLIDFKNISIFFVKIFLWKYESIEKSGLLFDDFESLKYLTVTDVLNNNKMKNSGTVFRLLKKLNINSLEDLKYI